MSKLKEAIDHVEKHNPLPRCHHGNALVDGGNERLEPSCGCRITDSIGHAISLLHHLSVTYHNETGTVDRVISHLRKLNGMAQW